MKFTAAGSTGFYSDCGRYVICRVTYVTPTGPQPRWEARRTRKHEDGVGKVALGLVSREDAETVCKADADA